MTDLPFLTRPVLGLKLQHQIWSHRRNRGCLASPMMAIDQLPVKYIFVDVARSTCMSVDMCLHCVYVYERACLYVSMSACACVPVSRCVPVCTCACLHLCVISCWTGPSGWGLSDTAAKALLARRCPEDRWSCSRESLEKLKMGHGRLWLWTAAEMSPPLCPSVRPL